MIQVERRVERLTPLFELARRVADAPVSAEVDREGKDRLLTTLAAERALPQRRPWLLMAAGVFALTVVAAIVFWPADVLDFRVEGVALGDGGYLAPDAQPATVLFSDGTALRLQPSARARIAEVTAHGARIVLERGRGRLSVVHRPEAAWQIEAGPYTIEVTGTAFDVEWSPDAQRLLVEMESGSVSVRGALARDGVSVRAGERLVAGGGELRIEAMVARSEAPTPAHEARAPLAQSAVPAAPSSSAPSWSQRLAAGEFAIIVREAEARGIGAVLASGALAELVALADAARYVGKSDIARRALEAQRSRFAGSREAATAAFLLGRMADDAGAPAEAIGFYNAHLSEGGAFGAEALGRKMLAEQRAGQAEAARASARTYLERHPKGAHAAAAKKLLGQTP
jgi:hypothetical protein